MVGSSALEPPSPRVAKIFDRLTRGTIADAEAALTRLDDSAPHPYQARRLAHLVLDPPYTGAGAQALWTRAFCQLLRHGQEETLSTLSPLAGRYREVIGDTAMGGWMTACVDELLSALRRKLEPPEAADPLVALEQAAAALSSGRREEALLALLRAFAVLRDPALGEAIEAFDRGQVCPGESLGEARWLATLEAADALGLSTWLSPLSTSNARRIKGGLGVLVSRPPDPRVGGAVVDALLRFPWSLRGVTAIRFVAALGRHGDHRRLGPVRAAARDRGELAHCAAILADGYSEPPAPGREQASLIRAIGAQLLGRRRAADPALGRRLLRAIYEDPRSTAARLVYADWLQERGDPRGELIALQCRDGAGEPRAALAEAGQRIEALLREHGESWLGPLRPVVMKQGLRFSRGFPAAVSIRECTAEVFDPLIGDPAWATIEEVDLRAQPLQHGMEHPVLRSLRALGGLTERHLLAVARVHRSRLEALGVIVGRDPDVAIGALGETLEGLPGLRRLVLSQRGRGDLVVPLMLRGALRKLEVLSVGYRHLDLADLLVDAEYHLPALRELVVETSNDRASLLGSPAGWVATFRRDARGELTRLEARFRPYPGRDISLTFKQLQRNLLPRLGRTLQAVSIEVAAAGSSRPSQEDIDELSRALATLHPGAATTLSS